MGRILIFSSIRRKAVSKVCNTYFARTGKLQFPFHSGKVISRKEKNMTSEYGRWESGEKWTWLPKRSWFHIHVSIVHWNFTDLRSVQFSSVSFVSELLRFRYLLKSHREVFRASPLLSTGNIFLRLCQSLVNFIHSLLHSFSLKSSPVSKLSLKYLR